MPDIVTQEWYAALIEELKATYVEKRFEERWAKIEMMHLIGKALREHEQVPMTKLVGQVSQDTGIHDRNLWFAVQFFDKFPELDQLPDGKATSWTAVRKQLSGGEKEEKEVDHYAIAERLLKKYGKEDLEQIVECIKEII